MLEGVQHTLETYERSGIADVVRAYQDMLDSSRTWLFRKLPYGYDTFSDGVDIGDWVVSLYLAATLPLPTAQIREHDAKNMMVMSPYDRHLFRNYVLDNPFRASGDTDKLSFRQWMPRGAISTIHMLRRWFGTAVLMCRRRFLIQQAHITWHT